MAQLSIPSYKFDFLNTLKKFRDEDYLLDCKIKAKNKEFKCHKIVVAAASPVLKQLLENNLEQVAVIEVNVSDRAAELFVQYCYDAKILVNHDDDLEVILNFTLQLSIQRRVKEK